MAVALIRIEDKGNGRIVLSYTPEKGISGYTVVGVLRRIIQGIEENMRETEK